MGNAMMVYIVSPMLLVKRSYMDVMTAGAETIIK